MSNKLPSDAFHFYFGLGDSRSYAAVAEEFSVSKTAVCKRAKAENWQGRVDELDRRAREKADERAVETVDEMGERHLKILKVIQGRAIEALKSMPLASAMDAVRALDITIKQERLIRGEPSDRTALTLEEIVSQQYEKWMVPEEGASEDEW